MNFIEHCLILLDNCNGNRGLILILAQNEHDKQNLHLKHLNFILNICRYIRWLTITVKRDLFMDAVLLYVLTVSNDSLMFRIECQILQILVTHCICRNYRRSEITSRWTLIRRLGIGKWFLNRTKLKLTRIGNVVNTALVLQVIGADEAMVDDQRAVVISRQVAPYYEDALEIHIKIYYFLANIYFKSNKLDMDPYISWYSIKIKKCSTVYYTT